MIKGNIFELSVAPYYKNFLELIYENAPGIIKELTDIISLETSLGLQGGINLDAGFASLEINLDLGSRRKIFSSKGTEKIDRRGLGVAITLLGFFGLALEKYKEARTDENVGVHYNLDMDGITRRDSFLLYDKTAANANGASMSFGITALFGFEVHIDLMECLDVIRYVEDFKEGK